jgi:hypothetical protein
MSDERELIPQGYGKNIQLKGRPKRVAPSAETRASLRIELARSIANEFAQCTGKYISQLDKEWLVSRILAEFEQEFLACWIPVAERPPELVERWAKSGGWYERSEYVFAWDGHERIIAEFYGNGRWGDRSGSPVRTTVTHWMPLPAPPAATNCCTATEVEAARNPKRTLEERAQEAAEEIVAHIKVTDFSTFDDYDYATEETDSVKAIILSRIGGAEAAKQEPVKVRCWTNKPCSDPNCACRDIDTDIDD